MSTTVGKRVRRMANIPVDEELEIGLRVDRDGHAVRDENGACQFDLALGEWTPVGQPEIAELLDVGFRTPEQWVRRSQEASAAGQDNPQAMPAPSYSSVNGRRAWTLKSILEWAFRTNKLPPCEIPLYVEVVGYDPTDLEGIAARAAKARAS